MSIHSRIKRSLNSYCDHCHCTVAFYGIDRCILISADEMRYSMVVDLLLKGSAFAYIGRDSRSVPAELRYVPEKYVEVRKNINDVIFMQYTYSVQGKTIYPYKLLKVLKNTDGFGKGKGIVQTNPLILDTAYQMLRFQKNQLLKGGNKKGFLKAEKTLAQPAMDSIKKAWNKLYSNENSESMVFLNSGIDFKEISSTSVEMQINQNMQTASNEIMKLFGTVDGILSDATVKNAVMPVIDLFEAAYDNDLLLESEKENTYFAFDTRELTRGDIQQRYNAYAVALQQNFMQLDEVRKLEDLPPLGVNYIKLGLNDVLLDPKTGKIYTPNTNAMVDMGSGEGANVQKSVDFSENDDIIENRGRFIQQDDGKLNGSLPSAKAEIRDKIIEEFNSTNFQGTINYPPKKIDIDSLTFDDDHINDKRQHNVTLDKAKEYIKESRISVTRKKPDGEFENYYGNNGAVYVDVKANKIRTTFHSSEFNNGTIRILDTVNKCEGRK